MSELLKKPPKLTNVWCASTILLASQSTAAATSTTTSQPTTIAMTSQSASALTSRTSSADADQIQSQVLVHNHKCADMMCVSLNCKIVFKKLVCM